MAAHVTGVPHPVRWSSEGDGAVLVLLHGLGGDRGFWAAESSALRTDFRVVSVDLRGSGGTPIPGDGQSVATLTDAVCSVLDDAGIRSAHMVGFSMGGLVAQSLAARYPDRVDRLVLASTYAVMNPQARMFLDAVRDVVRSSGSLRAVFPLVCPWLFSVVFLSDKANAAWLQTPDQDEDEAPAGWLAQYRAQREFDGRADLHRITAPTLVLAGDEDRLVTAADATTLASGIDAASIRTLPGTGHLLNVEQPARFLTEIRAFLLDSRS